MRITGNTVVRHYIKNLERNYAKKYKSEERISSNRKYTRASQSPMEAAKALKVRKAMSELEMYAANLKTADSIYSAAEGAIMNMSGLLQNATEALVYGANGTQGTAEQAILADSLEKYADEMVRLMNLQVADRKIFGGVNNDTVAFELKDGPNGKYVTYNGIPVTSSNNPADFPFSKSSYTDIGIGMYLNDDGTVNEQSALPVTFNAMEYIGCGADEVKLTFDFASFTEGNYTLNVSLDGVFKPISFTVEAGDTNADISAKIQTALNDSFGTGAISVSDDGSITTDYNRTLYVTNHPSTETQAAINIQTSGYPKNVIQLVLDAAKALRAGDAKQMMAYCDKINEAVTMISLSIARIGNAEEFIEFNTNRISNNLLVLKEQQNDLEGTDIGFETANWKVLSSIYNATLQMSTAVVPRSIFDFM